MDYKLASLSWEKEEYDSIKDIFSRNRFTMGDYCKNYEKDYASWTGSKYCVSCNSGSSANLLALAALRHDPRNSSDKRQEIIVPAVSWSTTYFPVIQNGYIPVFADVSPNTFNLSIEDVKKKVSSNTRAILAVNLLGNPCDFDALNNICDDNKITLLEDNCESMGALYNGKKTGTFGHIGTQSTFFSHHMSTMEGGLCITDDELTFEILKSLRAHGWVRNVDNKE